MTSKLLKTSCILIAAISFLIASCSKEGSTGPAGPAGPAGPPGTTGATGATGSANIIYSSWLNVTFAPASSGSSVWSADIAAPKLEDSILKKGDIKVYWNIGSDSTHDQLIVNLPVLDTLLFNVPVSINSYFSYQNIQLISNVDVSSYAVRGYNSFQFRYILIPGGATTGRYRTVDWKDYNKVKEYLGLKD